MKRCGKCGQQKPLTDFYKGNGTQGRHTYCKECVAVVANKWRAEHPERARHTNLKAMHRAMYGIELDVRRAWEEEQGLCAICGEEVARLALDHDHVTGRLRGLLCSRCNNGLGCFLDNPHLLDIARAYLCQPTLTDADLLRVS